MVARREIDTSKSSEDELLDAPYTISETWSLNTPQSTEDLDTPATNGDILELMKNIRAFFNSDLNVVREEITAVTARI
ncbi:Hypothetical predicted protein [Pelobates cultripes]|uniref:Uncharacterized protein n=1 Tax=Pelobates cultripes TaxID=61616 RepID=A0AAD1VNF8_PELCU|nr:Hypothetical predicted protein [Pelobates cultripes]